MQDEVAAMALKLQADAEANQHKLNESNVGFQLLKKSGWIEGSGLVLYLLIAVWEYSVVIGICF